MKIRSLLLLGLVLCLTLFGACSKQESKAPAFARAVAEEKAAADKPGDAGGGEISAQTVERRLVKEGQVGFQTDAVAETTQQLRQMIQKHNGFVAREEEHGYGGVKNFIVVARVPVNAFDQFVGELETLAGSFDSRTIGVRDITAEFVDTEARIKAKKEVEKNYLTILERAKTIEETLAVQKLLGEVRGEIESLEGRLRLMQEQTSYSTLTISYYERSETVFSFMKDVRDAFRVGWDGFLRILVGVTYAWVFILIGVGIIVYRKIRRKKG